MPDVSTRRLHRRGTGLPVLVLLAIAGASCSEFSAGNGAGLPFPTAGGSLQPTLRSIQDAIFTPVCTACHMGATAPQNLKLNDGNTCTNLICVASPQDPTVLRVQPGSPDDSFLIHKLEGTQSVGSQMPLSGPPYLPQSTIDVIRQWITDGAECESVGETTPTCPAPVTNDDPEGPWLQALAPWLAEAGRQAAVVRALYAPTRGMKEAPGGAARVAAADRAALDLLDRAATPGCPWFAGLPDVGAGPDRVATSHGSIARRAPEDELLAAVARAVGRTDPVRVDDAFATLGRIVSDHARWHATGDANEGEAGRADTPGVRRRRVARLLHAVASLRTLPASPDRAVARSGFLLHLLAADALVPDQLPWLDGTTTPHPDDGLPQLAWALAAASRGIAVEPR